MPAATTTAELLGVTRREYDKLAELIGPISEADALVKDADDTSIKDVIGHRAHWIGLFLGWYHDGLAGEEVALPAPGYNWGDLKRFNSDLRAAQADLGWDDARDLLSSAHDRLVEFIEASSDDELYAAPMAGGNNAWTPGRWAEAAGASHYRSAAKYVRARLRER